MPLPIILRELDKSETESALALSWDVFQEFEAPDYTQEGIDEFYRSIHDPEYLSLLRIYGAFLQHELIGVIATRSEGKHIALFFVKGAYHRQGIGRKLFQLIRASRPNETITVHSSPYAVPVYHKLGFQDTDTEQTFHGVRFTPMKLQ